MMVQMYNSFLRQIINILIDPSLLQIPFPAKEFANFALSWNCPESFAEIDQIGLASLLPEFNFKTSDFQNRKGGVLSLYVHFVDLLYNLPGANSTQLDELSEYILAQPKVAPAAVFFQIATRAMEFFSNAAELKSKRFLPFDYRRLQFNTTCQLLLQNFMNGEQFNELMAALVTPSKKRKNKEPQISSKDSAQKAHERLRLAMHSAQKLINNK
ncbi:hypothetical protein HK103_003727 [Boothiomyces macroporosus]|uniref:Uncharacterized protein n=1 Tax=Boothiomyces macroporosus TaxID=261099 RepID=A0AAD5Y3U2_9FUNG|nr:hypothetical protein HK103_003727 [Boothiomyces macroporosus]